MKPASISVLRENKDSHRLSGRAACRMDRKATARLRVAGVQYNEFYRMVKRLDVLPADEKGEPHG